MIDPSWAPPTGERVVNVSWATAEPWLRERARELHDSTCHLNHTDQCSWLYEEDDFKVGRKPRNAWAHDRAVVSVLREIENGRDAEFRPGDWVRHWSGFVGRYVGPLPGDHPALKHSVPLCLVLPYHTLDGRDLTNIQTVSIANLSHHTPEES